MFIFEKILYFFWQKFLFLMKISILHKCLFFEKIIRFFGKISIFDENFDFAQMLIFEKNI